MSKNYKKLGDYIYSVDIRNKNLLDVPLLGVSIKKVLMPSIANTVGTNMANYKIINRNQFAYGPVTSRNGDKISIALLGEYDMAIVSQAYTVFEVIDENKLNPEYLMMWFRRPEFDRYARFKSHGSARETFDWEELCDVELPVPDIEKQRAIVKEYQTVTHRIELNETLNQKLEETAQALYKHWFVDFEFPNQEGKPYKSSGGTMVYNEELDKEIPEGWEVKRFTDKFKLGGGGTPKTSESEFWDGNIMFFTPADRSNCYYCIKTEKKITELGLKKSSTKLYAKDTVFVTARGTVGEIALAGDDMAMNQSCYSIKGDNKYFTHQTTINVISNLKKEAVGAVFNALVTKDFDGQMVLSPVLEIENMFEDLISSVYDLILSKIKEVYKLYEIQEVLLSKMSKAK